MADIQLLITDDANRRALASVVDERHTPVTELDLQPADLYLVDDASLPQYQEPLEVRKREQAPMFCPVVLIRRQQTPIKVDLPAPETSDRPILVNEMLTAPVEQHVLFRRIANLLTRRQKTATLQDKNERLEEFASVVSHDLRSPLNVAEGRLELAQKESDSDHLEPIETALTRMERIIEDVLWLAREGRDIGSVDPVAVKDAVDAAWTIVADDADRATLRYGDGNLATTTIKADDDRFQQLLENLFRNAIDHGGADVTVTVGCLNDGIYVEDDGPGIPENYRDEVFDAGYSMSDEGTGFGLNIVKQVIDAHDWEIHVSEGSEGGARFEVTGIEFEQ